YRHGTGHFRQLLKPILSFDRVALLVQGVDIDHVARREHLRHCRRRLAALGSGSSFRPFDAIESDEARLPLLAHGPAEVAPRLEAYSRRLLARLEHHCHTPWRNIGERFDIGELDAPIA